MQNSLITTYIDGLRPKRLSPSLYSVYSVVVGSIIIAACAQIALPLPFTPVPITGQSFAVILISILLGSKRGAATAVLYLTEGAVGLPFFAGASSGVGLFLGPTGGYLFGFIFAAYTAGLLAEYKWDRSVGKAAAAMFFSSLIVLLHGTLWLSFFTGMGKAFQLGFLPFLPGDVIKTSIGAILLPFCWKYFGKHSSAK